MEQILNISNLTLTFGPKEIFRKAELQVNQGDRIGLLGLNGKGKSCLLKLLNAELSPDVTEPLCQFVKSNTLFTVCYIPQELPLPIDSLTPLDYFFYYFKDIRKLKNELDDITVKIENVTNELELSDLVKRQKDILDIFERKEVWKQQDLYKPYLKQFNLLNVSQPET